MPEPPPQPTRNETPSKDSNTNPNNRRRPDCVLKSELFSVFLHWRAAAFKIWAYAFKVVISPWMSFSDPPRPVGQNPFSNYSRRMRNKLNNKTASKCQRTSPEAVAAFRIMICTARGFDSSDTFAVDGQALSSAIWMRRINRSLPAISLNGLPDCVSKPQLFRALIASKKCNVRQPVTSARIEPQHFQFLPVFSIKVGLEAPVTRMSVDWEG